MRVVARGRDIICSPDNKIGKRVAIMERTLIIRADFYLLVKIDDSVKHPRAQLQYDLLIVLGNLLPVLSECRGVRRRYADYSLCMHHPNNLADGLAVLATVVGRVIKTYSDIVTVLLHRGRLSKTVVR